MQRTLAEEAYRVDSEGDICFLRLVPGGSWPAVQDRKNAVEVVYEAGYTAENCPASIKSWMLLMVGSLYETGEQSAERPAAPVPFVDRLLDRYRTWEA